MTIKTNKPAQTLRDGNIKATIWRNNGDNGPFYSVQFFRTYKDSEDNYQDTDSFTNGELLKLSHLGVRTYDAIATLRNDDSDERGTQ